MSPELAGTIGIIVLLLLIFNRIWIGAAMFLVGFLGFGYLAGWHHVLSLTGTLPYTTIADYPLTAIPLFILMGAAVSNTGVSADLYNTAYKWVGQLKGGLAMASVLACAGFAAVCGSSMATAITMGRVAYPEMKKYNYDVKLASGCIAAGGTMGILIPPSMGFILYGILTEQSVGRLFMAGIIPGILEAVFYVVTIIILCQFNPRLGPPAPGTSLKQKVVSLKNTWAMLALFLLVMGGIYGGIFTPTEAGAVGAFGAIIISAVGRRLTWPSLRGSVVETAQTAAMIVFVIVGAFIFMRFLTVSELPWRLGELVAGLEVSRYVVIGAIVVLYIILGCFMDIFASIMLTVPIIYPVILAMGFNPIWFGVIMVRMMEIGMITPPMGINIFVLAGAIDVPIGTIFRGIVPFVIADFFHVALLIAVPQLSLFLPDRML
jgi:C4-dicarboxylate transporter DctM subunit